MFPGQRWILYHQKHSIECKKNMLLKIAPKQRLAICLYQLGRGYYLYTIGEMVGLAESIICQIVVEVCTAILEELWSEAVDCHFPKSDEDSKEKLLDMDDEWQFPYGFFWYSR